MRRLAIDPGTVRTGVAVVEEDMNVATPLRTLQHRSAREAVTAVIAVVREVDAQEVVIGLPLRMDGGEGEAARRARRFASALQQHIDVPIILWDERLTTVSADRSLTAQGVRRDARKKVVDQAAATILLQSYLDAQSNRSSQEDDPWELPQTLTPRKTSRRPKSRRPHDPRKADRDAG